MGVSTMPSYVGQLGYTHRAGGRANQRRSSADSALYVCPATLHTQIFLDLANFKLMLASAA